MPSYRGEVAELHPQFAAESAAACVTQATGPVPIEAQDIEYSAEDERALEEYIRKWSELYTIAFG